MRLRTTAVALGMAGALILGAASSAGAAPAAPSVKVAQRGGATKVVARKDIDGDRRADRITLTRLSSAENARYRIRVRTAKGRTASYTFKSSIRADWGESPYYGAAAADRVRGREIFLRRAGGDGLFMLVLTWRSGRLVKLTGPVTEGPVVGRSRSWYVLVHDAMAVGYKFFSSHGRRYVTTTQLLKGSSKWRGRSTKSVWSKGAWRVVSRRTMTVSTEAAAWKLAGFNGLKW